jgi:hypothetical protein
MVKNASGDIFSNRYPDHPLTRELVMLSRRITAEHPSLMTMAAPPKLNC